MNTFGTIFKVSIFGESHGKEIGIIIDGCPSGIKLKDSDFCNDLARRKSGKKGTTARKESDVPSVMSGVFEGRTSGSPIMISFQNSDIKSSDYTALKDTPRPGHADFAALKKYNGFNDYRGGGHFSGRITAPLVAAGVVAKKITSNLSYSSQILSIGGKKDENEIKELLTEAIENGDSLGGVIECKIAGMPTGYGEPFFDSLESLISHAVFSIPAVKGIEFGAGFALAKMKGSEANDQIVDLNGATLTNNNGGINGGISNSNEILFRVAVKPTPSISLPQRTISIKDKKQTEIEIKGRHDVCIALRMGVIIEAVTAIVLADLKLLYEAKRG